MDTIDVNVHVTPLPDGVRGAGVCRLSLLVLPDTRQPGTFDLQNWPRLARCMPFEIFTEDEKTGNRKMVSWRLKADKETVLQSASTLWREIFTDRSNGICRFDLLRAALCKGQSVQVKSRTGHVAGGRVVNPRAPAGYLNLAAISDNLSNVDAWVAADRLERALAVAPLHSNVARVGEQFARRPFVDPLSAGFAQFASVIVHPELRAGPEGVIGSHDADALALAKTTDLTSLASMRDQWRNQLSALAEDVIDNKVQNAKQSWINEDAAPIDQLDNATTIAAFFHRTQVAMDLANPAQERPTVSNAQELQLEDCERKWAAIRALPTLAKFLGVIVDVEIALSELGMTGVLQVEVGGKGGDRVGYGIDQGFRPLERSRGWDSWPIKSGLVDWGDKKRFRIVSTDAKQYFQSLLQKAQATVEGLDAGGSTGDVDAKLPERHDAGLQVLDTRAAHRVAGCYRRAEELRGTQATLYADDLVSGLRADVQRQRSIPAAAGKPDAWGTLMARRVVIPRVWEAFNLDINSPEHHPYPLDQERDHGMVSCGVRLTPESGNQDSPVPSQAVLTWNGELMGLPCVAEGESNRTTLDPQRDLGLDLHFHPTATYQMPALRVGDRYRIALRTVLPNGGGVALAVAPHGKYCSEWFHYATHADARAPVLLIPASDPLVVGDPSEVVNERDDRIVLRTSSSPCLPSRHRARRYLVPARRGFDTAEQFGLLDTQLDVDEPRGAFDYLRRSDTDGQFPHARQGSVDDKTHDQPVTATVLTAAKSDQVAPAYFPDPQSRWLRVGVEREGRSPDGLHTGVVGAQFWTNHVLDATPILLELRTAPALSLGGQLSTRTISPEKISRASSVIRLELAAAEVVTLWYWAHDEPKVALQRNQRLMDGMALAAKRQPASAQALPACWQALVESTPYHGTGGWGKVEVVHAVDRPLAPARPHRSDVRHLRVLRVRSETAWPSYAASIPPSKDALVDGLSLADEVGGTIAHLVGLADLHRHSTVELRILVSWRDHRPQHAIRQNPDTGLWKFDPPVRTAQLLRAVGIAYDAEGAKQAGISLIHDDAGTLRGDFHDFSDTAARRLRFGFDATSRFVREFVREHTQEDIDLGHFDVRHGRLHSARPGESGAEVFEAWMGATARPAMPIVERVAWMMDERRVRGPGTSMQVEHRCHPRIYLHRDCFVSGEGELVALLLAPSDAIDDRSTGVPLHDPIRYSASEYDRIDSIRRHAHCELEPGGALAKFADRITRWGTDPTTKSARLEDLIAADRISGYVGSVQRVKLPAVSASAPRDQEATGDCAALLFQPQFDEVTGHWYVDIGIDTGPAHMPFVRLALALFQPNVGTGEVAAGDYRLSEPLLLDPLAVPARRSVQVELHAEHMQVRIWGVAYTRRGVDPVLGCRELTDTPLQSVRLLRTVSAGGAVATFDLDGTERAHHQLIPVFDGANLLWRCDFARPPLPWTMFKVDIDEADLFPRDLPEPACTQLIEKPAMFACSIHLADLNP